MKDYAARFYKGKAWQKCREGFVRSKGGLCEMCLKDGIITPGVIVHHKVHITPDNINDPNVTLNWNNMMLLCREHHSQVHGSTRRYKVDELGRVIF